MDFANTHLYLNNKPKAEINKSAHIGVKVKVSRNFTVDTQVIILKENTDNFEIKMEM